VKLSLVKFLTRYTYAVESLWHV